MHSNNYQPWASSNLEYNGRTYLTVAFCETAANVWVYGRFLLERPPRAC